MNEQVEQGTVEQGGAAQDDFDLDDFDPDGGGPPKVDQPDQPARPSPPRWLGWAGIVAAAATGLAAAQVWVDAFLLLVFATIGLAIAIYLMATPRRRAWSWLLALVGVGALVLFGTYLVQVVVNPDFDDLGATIESVWRM